MNCLQTNQLFYSLLLHCKLWRRGIVYFYNRQATAELLQESERR